MASASSRTLTLTTVNNDVTARVTYNARFVPFERFLAANGLKFVEVITIIGADPAGATTGSVLYTFPSQVIPVTAGAADQTIARDRSVTRSRSFFQEDAGIGDDDEIVCKIEIQVDGMPSNITAYTPQRILLG